jgi:hypothetical protein
MMVPAYTRAHKIRYAEGNDHMRSGGKHRMFWKQPIREGVEAAKAEVWQCFVTIYRSKS